MPSVYYPCCSVCLVVEVGLAQHHAEEGLAVEGRWEAQGGLLRVAPTFWQCQRRERQAEDGAGGAHVVQELDE